MCSPAPPPDVPPARPCGCPLCRAVGTQQLLFRWEHLPGAAASGTGCAGDFCPMLALGNAACPCVTALRLLTPAEAGLQTPSAAAGRFCACDWRGGKRDPAPEEAAQLGIWCPSLRVCSPCRWPDATLPTPSPPWGCHHMDKATSPTSGIAAARCYMDQWLGEASMGTLMGICNVTWQRSGTAAAPHKRRGGWRSCLKPGPSTRLSPP